MGAPWIPAYVALGSNLDGPAQRVTEAFAALAALPETRCVLRSRLYRSTPLGPQDQPDFVNAAAGLLTRLEPLQMLHALKALEQTLGRERPVVRWGPRHIDLDLIVHGTATVDLPELTVPHPGVSTRNFVLYPLLDLAPELLIPGQGRVKELAAQVSAAGLTIID